MAFFDLFFNSLKEQEARVYDTFLETSLPDKLCNN